MITCIITLVTMKGRAYGVHAPPRRAASLSPPRFWFLQHEFFVWEYTQSWPHSNATNVPCGDLLVMCMQGARGNARSEGPQLQAVAEKSESLYAVLALGLTRSSMIA